MNDPRHPTRTFQSAREAAGSLGLALLGGLPADPRFHPREAGLASLAPDPRFAARVYRFVAGPAPAVWVLGLGEAGEELPVAVAIAERAAASGAAPVLFVRPRESSTGTAGGQPVAAGSFAPLLSALLREPVTAEPTGLQGVLRARSRGRTEASAAAGEPLPAGDAGERGSIVPGGIVVAGDDGEECPAPPPGTLTHVILVVPFRDVPAAQLEERVKALARSGYPLAGMVAYGKEEQADAALEAAVDAGAAAVADCAAAQAQASTPSPLAPGALMTAARTEESVRPAVSSGPAGERRQAAGAGAPPDRIPVSGSWAQAFGPAGGRAQGPRRAGLPLFWWLVVAIVLLITAGVVFPRLVMRRIEQRPVAMKTLSRADGGQPAVSEQVDSGPAAAESHASEPAASAQVGGSPETMPEPRDAAVEGRTAGFDSTQGTAEPRGEAPPPGSEEALASRPAEGGAASMSRVPVQAPDQSAGQAENPLAGQTQESPASGQAAGQTPKPPASGHAEDGRPVQPGAQAGGPAPVADADGGVLPEVTPLVASRNGPFAILCGSVPRTDLASREIGRLAARGIEARLVRVEIPERGVWCRIVTGRFDDVEGALAAARAIVARGDVKAAQVVAVEGFGPPVSRTVERETP